MLPSFPTVNSLTKSNLEGCTSFCQLQLQRLVQSFSAIAGWLVYQDPLLSSSPIHGFYHCAAADCDTTQKTYLESKEFLKFNMPDQGWQRVELNDASLVYLCKLTERSGDLKNYLLLWCSQSFSAEKEKEFEAEIELLKCAIFLEQKYSYQQTQLDQLRQIVRRIEHQLRNPLALINLYTENLYRSLNQENQVQVAEIRDAVHHLTSHLAELVQCSQQTQLRVGFCDLMEVFEDSLQGLQLLIQEKQIQIDYPRSNLQIMADRAQIKQVFDNLLHNALCFSPANGQIYCSWQGFQQEVLVTIADQGPGLSATDLQHLFQPYYSNRPDGTGLGLAIARKIVLEHHGKLWADNLAQGGAQFSMSLPRYAPVHLSVKSEDLNGHSAIAYNHQHGA
jgi:signal transduction histidine kinase